MASGVAGRESSLATTRVYAALTRRYAPGLGERRLLLFLGDQLALLLALVLSGATAAFNGAELLDAVAVLGLAIVWWAAASAFDAYDIRRAGIPIQSVVSAWSAFALTLAVSVVVGSLGSIFASGLAQAGWFAVLSLLFLAAARFGYAVVFTQPAARRRAVVLGDEPEAAEAVRLLEQHARTEYQVIGVVRAGDRAGGDPASLSASPFSASQSALSELVLLQGADEVVNAAPESDTVANEELAALHRAYPAITVRNFSVLYEQLTGRVPMRYVCPHWRALVEARTGIYASLFIKRAMDVVVSAAALVALSPFFLLIGLAIKLDSRGPVIYRQQREGLHGRIFTMLKFRTMIADAEAGDAIWERHEDPRRTRVGKFLRPLHLDEMPQLLNVLSGSMSLVGPRPERSQFVRQLEKVAPAYRNRMLVRPGITGWAQVRFGYARSLEESIEKLEHDLYYVKHWSPFLDLVIGVKTFSALIQRAGNEAPSDEIMLASRAAGAVESEATSSPVSVASS